MSTLRRDVKACGQAICISLALVGCGVRTDAAGRTVLSTPTLGQLLGLRASDGAASVRQVAATSAEDHHTVAVHVIQVVTANQGHRIVVDGRVLATDTEADRVRIQGIFGSYVLVAEESGGNACPTMYQAVDLGAQIPAISPQFGTCSDLPRVSNVAGALRVSLPGFRAARAATYTFRNGSLTR